MSQPRSCILGLGGYVPPHVVTNDDLTKLMETSHDWIVERTGIEERRWTMGEESGSMMGAKAAEKALEDAGVDRKEIDCILVATLSPDVAFPGTGVFLQRELGVKDIPAIDIRAQCSGFIYGLSIADSFIRSGMYKKILLIGTEVHSSGLDKTTRGRDVAVLFGDGAGAAVIGISDSEEHQVISTHLHSDGTDAEILMLEKPGSGKLHFIEHSDIDEGRVFPKMQGRKVFKHAVTKMPQVIMEGMIANNLKLEDIDMLIPHQANLRINQMVAKMIGMPPEKVHNNIQKLGNTTAATIPLCMLDAVKEGKLKKGDMVCLVAFGAGLTWASAFLRY